MPVQGHQLYSAVAPLAVTSESDSGEAAGYEVDTDARQAVTQELLGGRST